jgi:hypothetical protein
VTLGVRVEPVRIAVPPLLKPLDEETRPAAEIEQAMLLSKAHRAEPATHVAAEDVKAYVLLLPLKRVVLVILSLVYIIK